MQEQSALQPPLLQDSVTTLCDMSLQNVVGVLEVLKGASFASNLDVQEVGMVLVTLLLTMTSVGKHKHKHVTDLSIHVSLSAITVAVAATSSPAASRTATHACAALRALAAGNAHAKSRIEEAGGCQKLVQLLESYPSDPLLQEQAWAGTLPNFWKFSKRQAGSH
jgi:hypothetical protein